jgi:hypothetical protein
MLWDRARQRIAARPRRYARRPNPGVCSAVYTQLVRGQYRGVPWVVLMRGCTPLWNGGGIGLAQVLAQATAYNARQP